MPTNTPNLNLIKPLVSEHYTVSVANANNDILDTAVGDVYTKSEVDGLVGGFAPQATTYTKAEVDTQVGLLAPQANPTFTGIQTLPNIVTNGIKFPATQVPSADPNTLDDYEKGTFMPVIYGTTTEGVGTYTRQYGSYVKIGKMVFFNIDLSITNHTGTGAMRISGLPFLPINTFGTQVFADGITMPTGYNMLMPFIATSGYIGIAGFNGVNRFVANIDTSIDQLYLSGSYETT